MLDTKQIKHRHKAAADIGKLTGTMEMISRARYHKHLETWNSRQDFDDELAQLTYLALAAEQEIRHPLMEENNSSNWTILVMGSDRGLCGNFNANINHLAEVHIKRAKRLRKKITVHAVGKKVISYLNSKGVRISKEYPNFDQDSTPQRFDEIADYFIDEYINKKIDYFGIVYTRFFSLASQHAQTLSILPIADLIDDLTTRSTVIWPWRAEPADFEFIPPVNKLFNSLASMVIRSAVSGCFLDSALSEHLYRVMAMRNATENSENMQKQLIGDYNRARQSQITNEIMDIVGGTISK